MVYVPSVSVIIPTLNAEKYIGALLTNIENQTLKPKEILVIDSSSDDGTSNEVAKHKNVGLQVIERSKFNHGTTRDMAFRRVHGDFVCFLTQDAIPSSESYLENIVTPMLVDKDIALVSGRQIPKKEARRFEKLVREFNYGDTPTIRSIKDLPKYGIKTFFASDTCSAYRRTAYFACGGFPAVETNEDMLMAARFIKAGLKVAYEPSAGVYHSHNFSLYQQYKRNKAIGEFLESHSDELMGTNEIGEGGRLVKTVVQQLLREKQYRELLAFVADCLARFLGNRVGRYV